MLTVTEAGKKELGRCAHADGLGIDYAAANYGPNGIQGWQAAEDLERGPRGEIA